MLDLPAVEVEVSRSVVTGDHHRRRLAHDPSALRGVVDFADLAAQADLERGDVGNVDSVDGSKANLLTLDHGVLAFSMSL